MSSPPPPPLTPPPPPRSDDPALSSPSSSVPEFSSPPPLPADAAAAHTSSLHHSLLGPSLLKAGQDGVDQRKVGEIIYNASKGSRYFKHEEKRDEQLTRRIDALLRRKAELESGSLANELRRVDEQIALLEQARDLTQIIVHVDCDAFYASVEELDQPSLKTVPMAVGGGVLTTCNYKAREFGVRSGMAGHIAKKICPQLVMVPINFAKYSAKAAEVRKVLVRYDERFEAAGTDEAFLNITKYLKEHEDETPEGLVERIRGEVLNETKISVSAGIAPNAKIAKICSNKNKPNGQFRVPNDRQAVMDFMADLPVRKVNGVGRVFERELDSIGVHTCNDIYTQRALLRSLFGEKATFFLLNCYLGLGRTEIHPIEEYERKSVGTESTFRDLSGSAALRAKMRSTAEALEEDLEKTQLAGRTLTLKIKMHDYQVVSRQRRLDRLVHRADDLYTLALPLLAALEAEYTPLKIRLMGLRVNRLESRVREKVDVRQWFFGEKRKREEGDSPATGGDDGEWEQWPEAEFERAQAAEQAEDRAVAEAAAAEEEEIARSQGGMQTDDRKSPAKEGEPPAEEKAPATWDCPICSRPQPADDASFNAHVDFCLSKQAIREAVQESSQRPPSAPPAGGGGSGGANGASKRARVEQKRGPKANAVFRKPAGGEPGFPAPPRGLGRQS